MKKEQVDPENAVVWIPDSKTPNGSLRRHAPIWLSTRFASRFASQDLDLGCFRATGIRGAIRRH